MSEKSFLLYSINLTEVEKDAPYKLAAIFVDDALHKRKTESKNIRQNFQKADRVNHYIATTAFFLGHNRWFRRFVWLLILVQLSLAIWERPSTRSPIESFNELRILAAIELFCLIVYMIDMLSKIVSLGVKNFFTQGWSVVKVLCVATMLLDVIIAMIVPDSLRFSRPLRSYLIIEKSRTVKNVFWSILSTIPKMTPIFIMQAFLILVYAQFGTVIFQQAIGPTYTAFSTLTESMVSMFILTTTENYPDVMLPAYMKYQVSALFFISFLIISQLFLLNLIIAVFYENYSTHILDSVREGLRFRKESLIKAFEAIKEKEGVVVFSGFNRMMRLLKQHYSPEKIRFIFHMLDKDHDEELNEKEFLYLCDVMQWDFVQERDPRIKSLSKIQLMMRTLAGTKWYIYMRSALIMGVALVTSLEVQLCSKKCSNWEIAENLFTMLFALEILFRIFAFGKDFFKSNWNKFDAFVIFVCFLFDIVLAKKISVEFIFLLKTLLLLRVIATMEALKVLVSTAVTLLPSIVCFCSILLSLFYFYAIIGMELFWGKIHSNNPYFGPINYYYINFDSLTHTMVALYGLMTVNNWNTYMAGVVSATSSWSRVYFITFYILAVVIVLSVILAFIIEAFVEQHKMKQVDSSAPRVNQFEGSVYDEEIRNRIEIALNRSNLSAAPGVKWRVEPKRNLETMYEALLKSSESDL